MASLIYMSPQLKLKILLFIAIVSLANVQLYGQSELKGLESIEAICVEAPDICRQMSQAYALSLEKSVDEASRLLAPLSKKVITSAEYGPLEVARGNVADALALYKATTSPTQRNRELIKRANVIMLRIKQSPYKPAVDELKSKIINLQMRFKQLGKGSTYSVNQRLLYGQELLDKAHELAREIAQSEVKSTSLNKSIKDLIDRVEQANDLLIDQLGIMARIVRMPRADINRLKEYDAELLNFLKRVRQHTVAYWTPERLNVLKGIVNYLSTHRPVTLEEAVLFGKLKAGFGTLETNIRKAFASAAITKEERERLVKQVSGTISYYYDQIPSWEATTRFAKEKGTWVWQTGEPWLESAKGAVQAGWEKVPSRESVWKSIKETWGEFKEYIPYTPYEVIPS